MAREGNVTLMCHCDEDAKQCHRHILRELILSNRSSLIGEREIVGDRIAGIPERLRAASGPEHATQG